jgi:quinol monooxygenase YgiN
MSHHVVVKFPCKEGKGEGEEFLSILKGALVDTRAFEGVQLVDVYVDADKPDDVILLEEYDARANQDAYLGWRMETGMLGLSDPFMAGVPTFTYLEPRDI